MGRESNADLEPELKLVHLVSTAAIQRDRIRPWCLAALLVSEATPLMAASRYIATTVACLWPAPHIHVLVRMRWPARRPMRQSAAVRKRPYACVRMKAFAQLTYRYMTCTYHTRQSKSRNRGHKKQVPLKAEGIPTSEVARTATTSPLPLSY